MFVCCVFDAAVESFGRPIFVKARGEAIRAFVDEVRNPESAMNKHPGDYDLYLIGMYDESAGELRPQPKERLMRGADAVLVPQ